MGIFDYFFSHAKQKQGKPIRDKIKNRKHFEKVLEKRMTEIHEDKLTILNSAALFFVRYFYILKRYFGINPLIWEFSRVLGSCLGMKSPTQTNGEV